MKKSPLAVRTLARCGLGACPAIYDNEDGTLTIVGAIVVPDKELAPNVAEDEQAVSIDAWLVLKAVVEKILRAGPSRTQP